VTAPAWRTGPVGLYDLGVGWALTWPGSALAVDPQDGFARAWSRAEPSPRLDAVLFTGPAVGRAAGLFPLLLQQAAVPRRAPLVLAHALADEAVPALAAAARQVDARAGSLDLTLESMFHGDALDLPGVRIQGLDVGDLVFRVILDATTVVFAGDCAAGARLDRLLTGAQALVASSGGHNPPAHCDWLGRR